PGALFTAGDVVFIAGAAWKDSPPPDVLGRLRQEQSVRVAHLIPDITPLRCPHMCAPDLTRAFARWLPGVLGQSDLALTISEHARRDLEMLCREQGLVAPPLDRVRWGDEPGDDDSESPPVDLLARHPGPFVLFVSSVALHKNQTLLFQVWRRL